MNLSLHQKKIISLINLLEDKNHLFTEEDKTALAALINTAPDDIETLANQVVLWYKNRPSIKEAILKVHLEKPVYLAFLCKGIPLTLQNAKEQINNALRLPPPEPKPNDSQQKPPKK